MDDTMAVTREAAICAIGPVTIESDQIENPLTSCAHEGVFV